MKDSIWDITDQWLTGDGPQVSVVVSCRARFARNIAGLPFPPRATPLALKRVTELVSAAIDRSPRLREFHRLSIDGFSPTDRQRLRESQVISQEMERGGEHRMVMLGREPITTIMVNEEDHLRLFVILPGFQTQQALDVLIQVENDLSQRLDFAWSERFGYLTACPSNTGTALRVSAMLHVPGLVLTEQVEEIMKAIPNRGMAVRGYYGENSAPLGNFYQISNETTLGLTEQQITDRLTELVRNLVEKEKAARETLFKEKRVQMEDKIFRALSVLASSRLINTQEAVDNLSVLRLGIDRGFLPSLSHGALNRLIVRVQPGHLQREQGMLLDAEKRDIARAAFLRQQFENIN